MPPLSPSTSAPASAGGSTGSVWLKRLLLLVGAPLIFLGVLESGLRLFGFGASLDFFIPDEKPGYYCANPAFTSLFLPAHFGIRPLNFRLQKHKEAGSVRVFVLGESAAQGTPEPGFGFAAQLQAQLTAHYPGRKVEVFNLGITAINSHVVYEVARQLPAFEPDLFVVYMGNNEVIGPYGPGSAYLSAMPPLWMIRASVWAKHLRTGQLLLGLMQKFGGGRGKSIEWRGMETFAQSTVRGNDPRLDAVYRNFENNLRDIIHVASSAGARTVVATLVANLKDSSPFVSMHRANQTPAELAAWQSAFDAGMLAWNLDDTVRAREQFTAALGLDNEYANTHYLLGRIDEAGGDIALARRHYLGALHWDALRFRPDPKLNQIIRRVAQKAGSAVRLVDAALEMGSDASSITSLAGREVLFEHVHFNWDGNAQLARSLGEACASLLKVPAGAGAVAGWLSPSECADALGYTDYGRLTMLGTIAELTGKSPFTNQITYGEYQTRLQAEAVALRRTVMTPEGLQACADKVDAALRRDPQNPSLMIRLENIEFDLRHLERATELVDRAMGLQPRSAVLVTQKANLLQIAKRYPEAEALLMNSTKDDPYYFPAWQVLVDVWFRTGQVPKGKAVLDGFLRKMPGNNYVRMARASLLIRSGEAGQAELEWRTVLRGDPSNTSALEQLVSLLQKKGQEEEAFSVMLEASKYQPKNYANNSRLAQAYAAKRDTAQMVVFLRALTESGPADASLYLELAQRLMDLDRTPEAMVYVRKGKKAAVAEGNAELQRVADEMAAAKLKQ